MTDSAADTILKRCDETMERHRAWQNATVNGRPLCKRCPQVWPCDAYSNARDLQNAVEKLHKIERLAAKAGMPGPVYVEQTTEQVEALGRIARSALTTIAERGEKTDFHDSNGENEV